MAGDDKVPLWDMILLVDEEIGRLEIWARLYEREGKALGETQARRLHTWRKIAEALELMREFEAPFVEMVKDKRRAQRQQMAAAAPARKPAGAGAD